MDSSGAGRTRIVDSSEVAIAIVIDKTSDEDAVESVGRRDSTCTTSLESPARDSGMETSASDEKNPVSLDKLEAQLV